MCPQLNQPAPARANPTTQLGAALAAAGMTPARIEFERALALAHNNGMGLAEICAAVAAFAERIGATFVYEFEEGHRQSAAKATTGVPSSSPPGDHIPDAAKATVAMSSAGTRSAGHRESADEASPQLPADDAAGDQAPLAEKATVPMSSAAPSASYIRTAVAARTNLARQVSVFDRVKVLDDRPIGDIRPSELPRLAREGRFQAHLAEALIGIGQWPNDGQLRVLMSAKRLETIIDQAKRDAFYNEH